MTVPVYDVEPYLRQCIDSIVNQTYRELEILLIDDGSPDNCGAICDEYAQKDVRIRVFHTENRGLSAARNLGLEDATGEYIGFVDSDDWIEPDMYETLLREATETDADMVVCGVWYERKGRKRKSRLESACFSGPKDSLQALIDCKINNTVWNKIYRHEMFSTIFFPEGHNYEDICIMHRILACSRKTVINSEPKYHCRIRKNSITKTNTADNLIDYADAYLSRYSFLTEKEGELFYPQNDINKNRFSEAVQKEYQKYGVGGTGVPMKKGRNTMLELKN